MSKTYAGYETWIRFAPELGGIGTAGTQFYTYDCEGDGDSLSMGEAPVDRGVLYGARGQRTGALRRGGYLPGGGLPAYPWNMSGSSFPLLYLLRGIFQRASVISGGGSVPCTWTFQPLGTNPDGGSWFGLTVDKVLNGSGLTHEFVGGVVDTANFHWETGGYLTVTPSSIKFLTGATNITVSGNGTPVTAGLVQPPNLSFRWQGQAIYPTSFDYNHANNFYDVQAGAMRGRRTHVLGDYAGDISLNLWRDETQGSYFLNLFAAESVGTFQMIGTADSGTLVGGTAIHFTMTAYCRVLPYDWPAKSGELVDTIPLRVMSDTNMTLDIYSDASAI